MEETRWRGRPVLAGVVRAVAYLVPVVCSVIAGAVVSRALPPASGIGGVIAWWLVVMLVSGVVVVAVERVARRLLPLSALLGLSLAFPDRAPSRFRVAVRAGGTRRLEERIACARGDGPDGEPAAAAAILELATLLNTHDRRTRGHSERVRVFADLLGEELQLPEEDRDRLRWAALLHDIGKLSVPTAILNKPGKPTDEEWAVLQEHPDESEPFLAPLRTFLGHWVLAASQHHERWDGGGYPRGLAGHQIAFAARIVSVADSYEVMTATRAYKRPMSAENARAELARCAGAQFDPVVVRAFLNISLGRLRFAAGPVAWLAQIPFLGELPRLATGGAALPNVALAAQTGVASTALAVGATVGAVAAPAPPVEVQATNTDAVVAPAAGVLDAEAQRDVGRTARATTQIDVPPPAVENRSDQGAEHGQGVGSDERAQREQERAAEQAARDAERAAREAERAARAAEREAARQAAEQARVEQAAAEQAAREQAEREQAEREAAERAARDAERAEADDEADDDNSGHGNRDDQDDDDSEIDDGDGGDDDDEDDD